MGVEAMDRTGGRYAWLPDHQLHVAATLAHADEVIAAIAEILFEYQSQPGGLMDLREVPLVAHSQTVVVGVSPIPRKVPLLAADALVALRSAIEHALFAEIEYRDGPLDDKAAKTVEMPAAQTHQAFETWVDGPCSERPALPPTRKRPDPAHRELAALPSVHGAAGPIEQLDAWFESLSDQDVFARMRRSG